MKKTTLNLTTGYVDLLDEKKVEEVQALGRACFGASFVNFDDRRIYDRPLDVILVKDGDKPVAFVEMTENDNAYEGIEFRKKVCKVLRIAVLDSYLDKGVGLTALQATFDYAKLAKCEYVDLTCKIDTTKFKPGNNEYSQAGFNNIKVYESVVRKPNEKNIYFRADVNSDVRNFSKAMVKSFEKFIKKDLNAIDEQLLVKDISKNYVDIVKTTKKLTKQEITEIKSNPLFKDLSISLKDMLKNNDKDDPTYTTRASISMGKVLKNISSVFKPSTSIIGDLDRIQHTDKVQRILCGVADEMINKQNNQRLKNNESFEPLKRV